MATSLSLSHSDSHSQTRKSFSLLLSISVTFFLLLLSKVNSTTETVSFTFNKFEPRQPNVILQRDALITSTGKLQLTKVEGGKPIYHSLGRALYSAPIRIWDNNTGNVASFVTAFSFVITAPPNSSTAEGLAFFLAPINTQPQGYGGTLGLFPGPIPSSSYETVAVEFDTNFNAWDPKGRHIGIDVNSITSIKTTPWALAIGEVANVVISYQASTKSLTASLVYPSLETSFILNAVVDFKAVLPEWVRVGFSATSGNLPNYIETHDVLSWSFESRLSDSSNDALENVTEAHLSSFVLPA